MPKRLSHLLLPVIMILAGGAGCYTQMRPSAGALESDALYSDGYWSDPYYDYPPYSSRWEMYPGLPWWYADYCRPWSHHTPDDSWDSYEEAQGRHGWDRGPGSPLPPRAGGSLGGGVGGSTTPAAPAPAQTSDEGEKDETPRDTDRSTDNQSSDRRQKDPDAEKKRSGWGR